MWTFLKSTQLVNEHDYNKHQITEIYTHTPWIWRFPAVRPCPRGCWSPAVLLEVSLVQLCEVGTGWAHCCSQGDEPAENITEKSWQRITWGLDNHCEEELTTYINWCYGISHTVLNLCYWLSRKVMYDSEAHSEELVGCVIYLLWRYPCWWVLIRGQEHHWELVVIIRNFLIHCLWNT